MEKQRREDGLLTHVAELFDLPADILAGLPHLEMVGGRQLFLERHRGILAYGDKGIDINTDGAIVRVRGTALELLVITAEELRIGGSIDSIEFLR
ncbi:MAG: YabP/YqfC family sporulation protein [Oscillospiraceae bacterium]